MPDERALLAAADLVTPTAVRVAATLNLADLIAAGVDTIPELAGRTGTNEDALGRMMRHLATHGVFAEPEPGRFALNPAAEVLLDGHPLRMKTWFDLDGFAGGMDFVFTELLHTVRTGGPAWEKAFGAPFWEHLAADPARAAAFDEAMAASLRSAAVNDYDWSGVGHVIDVGGGTGAMLAEVHRVNPGVRCTLLDLPETVARSAGQFEKVGQSFFDPLPAGADVYLLSAVLHDWDDVQSVAILRRCAEAAGETGRVVIIESHGAPDDDPAAFAENDLRMLVLSGGRERSVEEFSALVTAAGLTVSRLQPLPSGAILIEATARSSPAADRP